MTPPQFSNLAWWTQDSPTTVAAVGCGRYTSSLDREISRLDAEIDATREQELKIQIRLQELDGVPPETEFAFWQRQSTSENGICFPC